MIDNKKTFKDLNLGDTLYFASINSSNIIESRLIGMKILPDENGIYSNGEYILFTTDRCSQFKIPRLLYDIYDVVIIEFNNNKYWCSTSKETIIKCVIKAIEDEKNLWATRLILFINNLKDE
jgi:hypothetical protein